MADIRSRVLCLWIVFALGVGAVGQSSAATPGGAAAEHPEHKGMIEVAPERWLPRDRVIVVGRVSKRVRRHQPRVEALADWLASRLKGEGIQAGAGVIARSAHEMIGLLRAGSVDLVSESILTALAYEERAGATLLLHEWRSGEPYYQTVFVARKSERIYRLADLVGKRIAFEDRGSSSAYLLPLAIGRLMGFDLVELAAAADPVPPKRIGYVFAGSETNIAAWTARGLVEAGVFSNWDWDSENKIPPRFRDDLRIFYISRPLLRSVIVARQGLPPALRRAVTRQLRSLHTDADATSISANFYGVSRYDPLEGKSARALTEAREIYAQIRDMVQ